MSTLSGTSTTAQVLTAYGDNASYEEDGSTAKCQAFITAVRLLLSPTHSMKRSVSGGRGGNELELDQALLRAELQDARRWLADQQAAEQGAVTHFDATGFRE